MVCKMCTQLLSKGSSLIFFIGWRKVGAKYNCEMGNNAQRKSTRTSTHPFLFSAINNQHTLKHKTKWLQETLINENVLAGLLTFIWNYTPQELFSDLDSRSVVL